MGAPPCPKIFPHTLPIFEKVTRAWSADCCGDRALLNDPTRIDHHASRPPRAYGLLLPLAQRTAEKNSVGGTSALAAGALLAASGCSNLRAYLDAHYFSIENVRWTRKTPIDQAYPPFLSEWLKSRSMRCSCFRPTFPIGRLCASTLVSGR